VVAVRNEEEEDVEDGLTGVEERKKEGVSSGPHRANYASANFLSAT
jgi:hypothetical protein